MRCSAERGHRATMPVRTGVRGQILGHDQPPAGYRTFLLNFARPDGDLPRICARKISALRGDTRRAFTEMDISRHTAPFPLAVSSGAGG